MKLTDLLLNRRREEDKQEEIPDSWKEEVQTIPIHLVTVGKYQPRQDFDEDRLKDLADSIEIHGLLQPILVRKAAIGYEVIVGERRVRACKLLGWEKIPAVIRNVDDKEAAEFALIENLQREDLHVFEVAEGYQRLLREFELTQEELAERLGVSQANIANKIRLLRLGPEVRAIISREMLSERHSRALLRLEEDDARLQVLKQIAEKSLNVKQTEKLVESVLGKDKKQATAKKAPGGTRKLILKDLRLFTNSVRDLVRVLRSSGLKVEMAEEEDSQQYQIVVTVQKAVGGDLK